MFKNLILHHAAGDMPASAAALEEAMQQGAFLPCGKTQPSSSGWVPPREVEGAALLEPVGGHWMALLMIEHRILPSSVIKRRVAEMAKKHEQATGRAPGKRQLKEFKTEATAALLPKSFTRQVTVPVWIDPARKLVMVDAASAGRAELACLALIAAAPNMNLHVMHTVQEASTCMTSWVQQQQAPALFSFDREIELRSIDENPATVSLSECEVTGQDVLHRIEEGMRVARLAMTFGDKVSFVLHGNGHIKGLHFVDVVMKDPKHEPDAFDANVAITTGTLGPLLDALVFELGGVAVLPVEAAAKDGASADAGANSTADEEEGAEA